MAFQLCLCIFKEYLMSLFLVITVTVMAQKALWMVGDAFLKDAVSTFQLMKRQARQDNKPIPFMYNNYNVSALVPLLYSNTRSFLA